MVAPENPSFLNKVGIVMHEAGNSLDDATVGQKLTLGATALSLAFEWGTGNEAILGVVGGSVLEATHNTLLVASITGATSFTEQFVFGALMAASIKNFPKPVKKAQEVFYPDTLDTDLEAKKHIVVGSGRLRNRWFSSFILGTSVLMVVDNGQQPKSYKENIKNDAGNAALIGGTVVAIATSAALITNVGRNLGGNWETASTVIVDIIKNPLTYLAFFTGRIGLNKLKKIKAANKVR